MFDLSYFGAASFIMDGAALFILVGMMIYTTLYRRRGKPADKVFFALLVTDIIAAVFNCILYIIIGFGIPIESVLCLITFLMIFLAIDAFSILFCLYQMYRMEWEKEKVNRTILALCIPELILVVILFINLIGNNLYSGLIKLGNFSVSVYNFLNYAPIIICAVFSAAIIFKRNRRFIILLSLILALHLYLIMMSVINVTPLFLSIYLMLSHLLVMRESFYEEDA